MAACAPSLDRPDPGTRRAAHVLSNARADGLVLADDETAELEDLAANVSGAASAATPYARLGSPTSTSS